MYTPVCTKQFEKDTKRCVRRGKNMEKFKILVPSLLSGEPLVFERMGTHSDLFKT